MIDQALTNVRGRRIIASLIDLVIGSAAGIATAALFAQRFTMAGRSNGVPLWSADDVAQLEAIKAGGFDRKSEFGDSWYVWAGNDFWFMLAALAIVLLVLFVLLPAVTGRSLGKMLTGLRVKTLTGEPLGIGGHLTRTIAGVVDGFPYFLPGLLGWVMASRSPYSQRIGDRIAGSVVVGPGSDHSMVLVAERLETNPGLADFEPAAHPSDLHMPPTEAPTAAVDLPVIDQPNLASAEVSDFTTADVDLPTPQVETSAFTIPDAAISHAPAPDLAVPDIAAPDVAVPQASMPEVATPDISMPEVDTPEISVPGAEMPDISKPGFTVPDAGAARLGLSEESASGNVPWPDDMPAGWDQVLTPVDQGEDAPPPPRHRAERSNWAPPIAKPAPVWSAADPARSTAPAETAPATEPLPQTSAAEHVTVEADIAAATPVEPAAASTVPADAAGSSPDQPIWNDQWKAWLYYDPSRGAWLRHDTDADRWVVLG